MSNPPATASPGGKFQVTDTVQNEGGVATTSSTTRYYLSKDRQKGVGDPQLNGNHSVPGLAPGASYTKTMSGAIPSAVPAGTYYLLACADDKG